jgi:hypothetical protein
MVSADTIRVGDTVRDRQLWLEWAVVARDEQGQLQIERNEVVAVAGLWDLELVPPEPRRTRPGKTHSRSECP